MSKPRIKRKENVISLDLLFEKFITEKKVLGLSQKTLLNYKTSFKLFREVTQTEEVTKEVIINYIAYLTEHYKSISSINHHIRVIRVILYYFFENGLECERFKINLVKGQESVKPTYSDEDLERLLAKPATKCSFSEYRSWIIIQTLLATGMRASTLLNVKLKDVCLSSNQLILAHTKNKKAQIVPISSTLSKNLKTYISLYRDENEGESYLFPNVYDEPMKYYALRLAIERYNKSRGVSITSIHCFRHTFAKKWILNRGDLIALQKILGHSTMEMTRRYVNLYSVDLQKDFDNFCPLETMMPHGKKHIIK